MQAPPKTLHPAVPAEFAPVAIAEGIACVSCLYPTLRKRVLAPAPKESASFCFNLSDNKGCCVCVSQLGELAGATLNPNFNERVLRNESIWWPTLGIPSHSGSGCRCHADAAGCWGPLAGMGLFSPFKGISVPQRP